MRVYADLQGENTSALSCTKHCQWVTFRAMALLPIPKTNDFRPQDAISIVDHGRRQSLDPSKLIPQCFRAHGFWVVNAKLPIGKYSVNGLILH